MTREPVRLKMIDVGELPSTLFDTRSPLWWGNLWGLVIETVVFGILAALYFSVRMMLSPFPPPRVDRLPILYDSSPELFLPTIVLVLLLMSLVPAIILDLAARRREVLTVKVAQIATLVFTVVLIVLRFYEFDSLHFRWDDNAYGSVIWAILIMHLIHLIVLACEDVYITVWTFIKGLDDKHSLDITVTAVYWYWIVGTWVLLYILVYWAPRIL